MQSELDDLRSNPEGPAVEAVLSKSTDASKDWIGFFNKIDLAKASFPSRHLPASTPAPTSENRRYPEQPKVEKEKMAYENYDSPSSSDDESETGSETGSRSWGTSESDSSVPDLVAADEEPQYTAEDYADTLQQLQKEKVRLDEELKSAIKEVPLQESEMRQKIAEDYRMRQTQVQMKTKLIIRKRDKLAENSSSDHQVDSDAHARAEAAMRELLMEEEKEKAKLRNKAKGKKSQGGGGGGGSGGEQLAGEVADAAAFAEEAVQNQDSASPVAVGAEADRDADGKGRKLTKAEKKKLIEERRAEALREKKAEKRFFAKQRKKEEREKENGGGGDDSDELDLESAFALAQKKPTDKTAGANDAGKARLRCNKIIMMHADNTSVPSASVPKVDNAFIHPPPTQLQRTKSKSAGAVAESTMMEEQDAAAKSPAQHTSHAGSKQKVKSTASAHDTSDFEVPASKHDVKSQLTDMGFAAAEIEKTLQQVSTVAEALEIIFSAQRAHPPQSCSTTTFSNASSTTTLLTTPTATAKPTNPHENAAAHAGAAVDAAGAAHTAMPVMSTCVGGAGKGKEQAVVAGGAGGAGGAASEEEECVLTELSEEYILGKIELRKQAREKRDFKKADSIRDTLLVQGVLLEDKGKRTLFKRVQPRAKQKLTSADQVTLPDIFTLSQLDEAPLETNTSKVTTLQAALPVAGSKKVDEQGAASRQGGVGAQQNGGGGGGSRSSRGAVEACTLRVENVGREISHNDLWQALSEFGELVGQIKFLSKSCAFITLPSAASAHAAMQALNGTYIGKSKMPLAITLKAPPPPSVQAPQQAQLRRGALHQNKNHQVKEDGAGKVMSQGVADGHSHHATSPVIDVMPGISKSQQAVVTRGAAPAPKVGGQASSWHMPPADPAAAAAQLKSNVKAERLGAVPDRDRESDRDRERERDATTSASASDGNGKLLKTWHALDPLDASRRSGARVGNVHGTAIDSQESQVDNETVVDRYNKSLLGKALLAFEGYAQLEQEKVLGIQRAINSPKTATIFEKWKHLPCLSDLRDPRDGEDLKHAGASKHNKAGGGSVHGAIGQGIKKHAPFNHQPQDDNHDESKAQDWQTPPPLVAGMGMDAVFAGSTHPHARVLQDNLVPASSPTPQMGDASAQRLSGNVSGNQPRTAAANAALLPPPPYAPFGSAGLLTSGGNEDNTVFSHAQTLQVRGAELNAHMYGGSSKALTHEQLAMAHASMASINMNAYAGWNSALQNWAMYSGAAGAQARGAQDVAPSTFDTVRDLWSQQQQQQQTWSHQQHQNLQHQYHQQQQQANQQANQTLQFQQQQYQTAAMAAYAPSPVAPAPHNLNSFYTGPPQGQADTQQPPPTHTPTPNQRTNHTHLQAQSFLHSNTGISSMESSAMSSSAMSSTAINKLGQQAQGYMAPTPTYYPSPKLPT